MSDNTPLEAIDDVLAAWIHEEWDGPTMGLDATDLFVVWYAYVLGNWKALVSTDRYKGLYWEVTRNTKKGETYVDLYRKTSQIILEDDEEEEK